MLCTDINQTDRIATLTLDRPAKRNALSLEFMQQVTCALSDIGARTDVGVVILNANGPVLDPATTWPSWSTGRFATISRSSTSASS